MAVVPEADAVDPEVRAAAVVDAGASVVELGFSVVGEHVGGSVHVDDDVAYESCDGYGGCDEMSTLTCTVEREEAWLFEATRSLLDQLGVRGTDAQAEALLAEGQESLLRMLPRGTLDPDRMHGFDMARQRWLSELGRWRGEAEALCEKNIRGWLLEGRAQHRNSESRQHTVAVAAALGMASLEKAGGEALDAHVRVLSEGLARHELELSVLVLRFHRADGWRRLGYATETQYARERLGLSRSSLLARRLLALRLERLPVIAAALGAGQVGVEAALQVARVATANTEAAWVARARTRTIKHLKEEVTAALAAVRWSGEGDCPPAGGCRDGCVPCSGTGGGERSRLSDSIEAGRSRRARVGSLHAGSAPAGGAGIGAPACLVRDARKPGGVARRWAPDVCRRRGGARLTCSVERRTSHAPAEGVASQLLLVAWARGAGTRMAAARDGLAEVPLPLPLARFCPSFRAPSARHGGGVRPDLHARSISVHQSRV